MTGSDTGSDTGTPTAMETARSLNAFIRDGADLTPGDGTGPLAGVRLSIKDNIAVNGAPVTGACPAFAAVTLPENPVIDRLRTAGATFVGKTNLHELAFGVTGANAHTGDALNPFDRTRLAGGSSSGAAISVAVGAADVALGTDTGGSCRIPAAHCGVVGFRPSLGRYPGDSGLIGLSPSRDTIGLLARTVADIRRVDAVMVEPGTATAPTRKENAPIRLGMVAPESFNMGGDPAILDAYAAALDTLERQGVTLVTADLCKAIAADDACGFVIAVYESIVCLGTLAADHTDLDFPAFVEAVASPDVKGLLAAQLGPEAIPEALYRDALVNGLPKLRHAFDKTFETSGVDALVYPTSLFAPPPVGIGEAFATPAGDLPTFPAYTATTRPDSMAGQPTVALPFGLVNGLPAGLQITGRRGDDANLLAIAARLETLLPPRPVPPGAG